MQKMLYQIKQFHQGIAFNISNPALHPAPEGENLRAFHVTTSLQYIIQYYVIFYYLAQSPL